MQECRELGSFFKLNYSSTYWYHCTFSTPGDNVWKTRQNIVRVAMHVWMWGAVHTEHACSCVHIQSRKKCTYMCNCALSLWGIYASHYEVARQLNTHATHNTMHVASIYSYPNIFLLLIYLYYLSGETFHMRHRPTVDFNTKTAFLD